MVILLLGKQTIENSHYSSHSSIFDDRQLLYQELVGTRWRVSLKENLANIIIFEEATTNCFEKRSSHITEHIC